MPTNVPLLAETYIFFTLGLQFYLERQRRTWGSAHNKGKHSSAHTDRTSEFWGIWEQDQVLRFYITA